MVRPSFWFLVDTDSYFQNERNAGPEPCYCTCMVKENVAKLIEFQKRLIRSRKRITYVLASILIANWMKPIVDSNISIRSFVSSDPSSNPLGAVHRSSIHRILPSPN